MTHEKEIVKSHWDAFKNLTNTVVQATSKYLLFHSLIPSEHITVAAMESSENNSIVCAKLFPGEILQDAATDSSLECIDYT